jgi:protein SCO1/2
MNRSFLGSLLMMLLAGSALGQTPAPDAAIEQRLNEQAPLDLVFQDETGRPVALREFFGKKPVILVLGYYRCPRLCSLVLNSLTDGLHGIDYAIGKEFSIVTVSVDPREKPELAVAKKTAYIEKYGRPGASAGWHFLTGEETPIKNLADAVGFRYAYDPKTDQYAHASGIMILTPTGKIARYYFGLNYSPRDLRFGLEDASAGNVGTPVASPLRMLCFAYDPTTGKYTLMTLQFVRLSGLLTLLAIAGFYIRAWRRKLRTIREGEAPAEPNCAMNEADSHGAGSAGASPSQP